MATSKFNLDYAATAPTQALASKVTLSLRIAIVCAVVPIILDAIAVVPPWDSDLPVVAGLLIVPVGLVLFLVGAVFCTRWAMLCRMFARESEIKMRWWPVIGLSILLILSLIIVFACAKWAGHQIT